MEMGTWYGWGAIYNAAIYNGAIYNAVLAHSHLGDYKADQ